MIIGARYRRKAFFHKNRRVEEVSQNEISSTRMISKRVRFFSLFFFPFFLHHLVHVRRGKGLGCREGKKKKNDIAAPFYLLCGVVLDWVRVQGLKTLHRWKKVERTKGFPGEVKGKRERQSDEERGKKWGFRIKIIPSTEGYVGRSFLFF